MIFGYIYPLNLTSKEEHPRITAPSEAIDDAGDANQEVESITPDLRHRQTFAIGRLHYQLIGHFRDIMKKYLEVKNLI